MCFSAEASFGLSASLILAGAYCVKNAAVKNRQLLPVAVIPIVFSVQQFSEGWVWIGLGRDNAMLVTIAARIFLFFAIVFWPFWIPFCSFVTADSRRWKTFFGVLCLFGLITGAGVFVPLLVDGSSPVANVDTHSIHYDVARSPVFQYVPLSLWELIYFTIVSSPLLVSKDMRIVFLGVALVLSAAMSYLLFWYNFTSVWCFFAAMLSLYLCVFFRKLPFANSAPTSPHGG